MTGRVHEDMDWVGSGEDCATAACPGQLCPHHKSFHGAHRTFALNAVRRYVASVVLALACLLVLACAPAGKRDAALQVQRGAEGLRRNSKWA